MPFTGYSINGIPLHDATRGWRILRDGTQTQGGITKNLSKVPSPGRPGYTPAPTTFTEQMMVFVVRCSRAGLEPLLNLAAAAQTLMLTTAEGAVKVANVELASALPNGDEALDANFDVTITLIAYEGVWRDFDYMPTLADGTQEINITSPVQTINFLPDNGGPVFDEAIFIRGVFGQFVIADAGGSFLKTTRAWPGSSSTGLLWFGATQQAFLANNSDPFTPVSDRSQYVDVSGNGGFRLTPVLIGGDPANRHVELTITTLTQTSTSIRMKAKRAYRMS